jgi:hypothetical protein
MRARYRIVILLSVVTFTLGALVYLSSYDDELAIIHFRWLIFNHPIRNLFDAVTSLVERNPGSLWYAGLSLAAMIIVGAVFKFITSAELQAFSDRLISAEVAKAELETALQVALEEKHAQARTLVEDLEANSSGILVLGDRLSETEKLLKSRERELLALRSKAEALTEPPIETASFRRQEQSELRNELQKKTELLQTKDFAIQLLEKNLTEKIDALETELNVNKKLVNERHKARGRIFAGTRGC